MRSSADIIRKDLGDLVSFGKGVIIGLLRAAYSVPFLTTGIGTMHRDFWGVGQGKISQPEGVGRFISQTIGTPIAHVSAASYAASQGLLKEYLIGIAATNIVDYAVKVKNRAQSA